MSGMSPIPRPKAISFDLDDTLVNGASVRAAIAATCDRLAGLTGVGATSIREANNEAWQGYWPQVEADWTFGRLRGDVLSTEVWRRSLIAVGADASLAPTAREIHAELALGGLRLFDDAAQLLERLHGDIPMAVITNGASDTQRATLRAARIEDRFAVIVISGEVSLAKPDPSIYRLAIEALGVQAAETWHIGDSLSTDVAGALAAGLIPIWLNRRGLRRKADDPRPQLDVRSLDEIRAML